MLPTMKNKKSQGLPLNLIIIAIIALIVLVIIIAIFAGKIRFFPSGVQSCEGKGGTCYTTSCAELNLASILNHDCQQKQGSSYKYCCINVTG